MAVRPGLAVEGWLPVLAAKRGDLARRQAHVRATVHEAFDPLLTIPFHRYDSSRNAPRTREIEMPTEDLQVESPLQEPAGLAVKDWPERLQRAREAFELGRKLMLPQPALPRPLSLPRPD